MLTFLEDQLFKAKFEIVDETLNWVRYSRITEAENGDAIERLVSIEREQKVAEVSDWEVAGYFLTGERYNLRSRPEIQNAILAIIA